MQYLKELSNGNRVRVSQGTYNVDRFDPNFRHVVATGMIRIYSIANQDAAVHATNHLKYGGRGRGGAGAVWGGA